MATKHLFSLFFKLFAVFAYFFMKLHQNRMCNKRFNHKNTFLSELLLLNSENIILFKIDRVVDPDGVRILCKYLGKLFFLMMKQ